MCNEISNVPTTKNFLMWTVEERKIYTRNLLRLAWICLLAPGKIPVEQLPEHRVLSYANLATNLVHLNYAKYDLERFLDRDIPFAEWLDAEWHRVKRGGSEYFLPSYGTMHRNIHGIGVCELMEGIEPPKPDSHILRTYYYLSSEQVIAILQRITRLCYPELELFPFAYGVCIYGQAHVIDSAEGMITYVEKPEEVRHV
jgi:hypothetical protein